MTFTIYTVQGGGDPAASYATKAEALATARATSRDSASPIFVTRERTVPIDKSAFLRIVNSLGGYAAEIVDVAEFRAGRRVHTTATNQQPTNNDKD